MARILHVSAAEYHADPCPRPSLNRSVALIIANRNAKHGRRAHPRFGGFGKSATDEMNDGTIEHALILGQPDPRVILDVENYRTKAAQEARDAALAAGKIPVKKADADFHTQAAEEFLKHIRAMGLEPGKWTTEIAIEWEDEGVLCRSRLDAVDVPHIWDLKFVEDASPKAMAKACVNYGYDIQAHTSIRALESLYPDWTGRVPFTILACEWGTFDVIDYPITGAMRELGEHRWNRAREDWREGLENNNWRSYAREVLAPPNWAMFEEGLMHG